MHILIIGTVRPAHQKALEMGHEISLIIDKKNVRPSDVNVSYRKIMMMEADASIQEYQAVADAIHQHSPVDAICCFNDTAQEHAIAVAEKLKLPFSIDLATLDVLYNKQKTRALLHAKGLDDTQFREVTSVDDITDFFREVNAPIIVKPFDSTGSSGIIRIKSAADINQEMQRFFDAKHTFPAIAEEFLQGKEYSVEAFSENGEHVILGITEKLKDKETFIENGHAFPASISLRDKENIESFVRDMLSVVGIKNGLSHTEVMLTEKGPKLIESHSRAGGDRIFKLIELVTGIDVFEIQIRQTLGEKVLTEVQDAVNAIEGKAAAIRFLSLGFDTNTKLVSIDNIEAAQAVEGVVEVMPMKEAGSTMGVVTDSFARTVWAVAKADSPERALEQADKSLQTLKINLNWEMQ
ncbi:ATP-grasp domain-containing protein [Aestuariibacter sp. AA17]|uniref:ATP-grasp domain-containing protein n=1 Tax=Fluctibacter corallii TaxID=2984329 RepID=A0ABT3A786_9ALTE|nr:ATP-grasp domain-containing protein [Aestuariibacter sp. AA17]MCV2884447.1 ATP-grasp domain-containing protein [Aestuariibacter sp. AA17]